MSGLLSAIIRHYCGAARLRDHVIDTTVAARRRMRSARPARPRSRVATPSATPQRFQDFTKDFKISPKISRFHDFKEDFKISVEISAVVYEISASGGPLGLYCTRNLRNLIGYNLDNSNDNAVFSELSSSLFIIVVSAIIHDYSLLAWRLQNRIFVSEAITSGNDYL